MKAIEMEFLQFQRTVVYLSLLVSLEFKGISYLAQLFPTTNLKPLTMCVSFYFDQKAKFQHSQGEKKGR